MSAKSKSLSTIDIRKIYQKYKVPNHIVLHMKKVAHVAIFLSKKISAHSKVNIDLSAVKNAALLHDILKIVDFKTLNLSYFQKKPNSKTLSTYQKLIKKYHQVGHESAAKIELQKLGQPKLAQIISKHGYNSLIARKKSARPSTLEEKILYYADKRVKFDQIVSLKERIKDGQRRYFLNHSKKIPPSDTHVQKALFTLEKELCSLAGIKPGQIF